MSVGYLVQHAWSQNSFAAEPVVLQTFAFSKLGTRRVSKGDRSQPPRFHPSAPGSVPRSRFIRQMYGLSRLRGGGRPEMSSIP